MSEPILIEAGASEFGWSRLGTFLRCPRLFYQKYVAKLPMPERVPLARGRIAHAGLAQHFARIACAQSGRDPLTFEEPHVAMGIVAQGVNSEIRLDALNAALEAFETHRSQYPVEIHRIRAVEFELKTEFEGFPYTARADLIWEDNREKRWIIDHKIVARIEDKAFARYSLSGQFLGLMHLGQRKWGEEFAGVMLNVIGIRDKKCVRRQIEPAPYALTRFPENVVRTERSIRALLSLEDPNAWPMALHEQVCMSAYGPCDEFERCRWGCV